MNDAAPPLLTERLELHRPDAGDLAGLMALVAPEAVHRYLAPGVETAPAQFERLLRNAGSWSLYGYGMFVVRPRGEPAIIGVCGVFHSWRGYGRGLDDVPEAGWIFASSHWGRGLAGEAMRVALDRFDAAHAGGVVKCMIAEGNAASRGLAAGLGFAEYDRFHAADDGTELVLYERHAR